MITLQFIGGDDLSSRLIGWFSSGHLSHVDAVMPDGSLVGARSDHVGDAPTGVQKRPASYVADAERRVRFKIPTTQEKEARFYAFINSQIGKKYDYRAILGFVFARDWRERDSWICSELVSAALENAAVVPPLYLAANKITPVSLALALSVVATVVS
jgi:hypothetical protein